MNVSDFDPTAPVKIVLASTGFLQWWPIHCQLESKVGAAWEFEQQIRPERLIDNNNKVKDKFLSVGSQQKVQGIAEIRTAGWQPCWDAFLTVTNPHPMWMNAECCTPTNIVLRRRVDLWHLNDGCVDDQGNCCFCGLQLISIVNIIFPILLDFR